MDNCSIRIKILVVNNFQNVNVNAHLIENILSVTRYILIVYKQKSLVNSAFSSRLSAISIVPIHIDRFNRNSTVSAILSCNKKAIKFFREIYDRERDKSFPLSLSSYAMKYMKCFHFNPSLFFYIFFYIYYISIRVTVPSRFLLACI